MCAGFYVAVHPWLETQSLHKVGHTGNLAARFHDGSYTTCFTDEWRYCFTLETPTKKDAQKIEAGVLYCAQFFRVKNKELLCLLPEKIKQLAEDVANCLDISYTLCDAPTYEMNDSTIVVEPSSPSDPLISKEKLRHLVITPVEDEDHFADDVLFFSTGETRTTIEDRLYQREAANMGYQELQRSGRTILQMACRCGKTRVAYLILSNYLQGKILYLVPGLSLLRQTLEKLYLYGISLKNIMLVGSDQTRIVLNHDTIEMTTNPVIIVKRIQEASSLLVIATYQSSTLLVDDFDLIISDECHRICGEWETRSFTHVLLNFKKGHRLFLTATPRYDTPLSMKNRDLFGGVAFRYYLREGIEAGYVNDFELQMVAAPKLAHQPGNREEATKQIIVKQIIMALAYLKTNVRSPKMLVFTRDIKQAKELYAELVDLGVYALIAHSTLPRQVILKTFTEFCSSKEPVILLNCRLFQEGVEVPELNAVFFAAPRHSPRDIIQSICRPLNKQVQKPHATIFLPLEVNTENVCLDKFSSIIPFADALASEDPRFYEHLLNPSEVAYPINWIGAHGSVAELLQLARHAIRYGTQGKIDRLTRSERLPWKAAFAELKRTVEICCRYPKINDGFHFGGATLRFDTWYKWVIKSYLQYKNNEPSSLEPYQVTDLESLQDWTTRGVGGPYPWEESMAFLETWLAQNKGELVAIDIHQGGWIGLDATPMERLSGVLTTVSQRDGRSYGKNKKLRPKKGFMIPPQQAEDLDRIFGKYNLKWRKDRVNGFLKEDEHGNYTGEPTCIQEAYQTFKEYVKTNPEYIEKYWPGYAKGKHKHQELPHIWESGLAPPRYKAFKDGNKRLIQRSPKKKDVKN
ncbi:pA859L [African swine fever virus]|uniref:Probable helicase A859L n=1 Tax=African swine fever virus TaxID=10497 RepID=A0A2Z5DFT6_ASF|nr:pA859L [African swine fever virus]AXB49443.1 pA859L [African swine fever virus]AXB49615.1 pA859L [African swine fever virus]AXB49786.1 pA859L [African swine fever virus]AXB49959.1 pA859L [African swine fever virus]